MSYELYKIVHIVGLLLVFLGLGGAMIGTRSEGGRPAAVAGLLHGLGLLLMLVAGFGMMARLDIAWPWPTWLLAKLLVWLTIGALPALVKREVLPRRAGWVLAALLGGIAAWLAITKPF
jgi:hypothetical protein